MKEISVIIPVYNSEKILKELCFQINDSLKNFSYELILINDCSSDNSWLEICKEKIKYNQIIGINLRKNSGQDNALIAGLNICKGEYAVIMDDDLQHSPKDIITLVSECKKGYDVCFANFEQKKQKLWKNLGSWFNGKIAEILINKPSNIYLSPFEVIHKDIVKEVINYKGPYPYIQGLILRATRNVTQVKIQHHRRYSGNGNFNLVRSLRVFMKLSTSFSVIPLRLASLFGLFSASIGFILGFYYLIDYFGTNQVIEGWTSLMVVILFLGGLILISLGVIGEYLGRLYLNINNEPQYIIKEII